MLDEYDYEVFSNLFSAIDEKCHGYIHKKQLLDLFKKRGISVKDERVREIIDELDEYSKNDKITLDEFINIVRSHISFVNRIIKGDMVIPEFGDFADTIKDIFAQIEKNKKGDVAHYIPQLARVNPDQLAVSIYTIDGQRLSLGDADVQYCVQSTCKPINYCIAMELNGDKGVHNHVGREPSGRSFNEITLNPKNLPHNPMINAGAIMCSSMIEPKKSLSDRFDKVMSIWEQLSGGVRPGYNNSVYHSEKETADRNFALAHFMREMGAFPDNTNIKETLDFYFQCCSIEVTANNMATIAATFANAGVCPTTNNRVFSPDTVKNCLSLMYSCGMYDFSGEFAFSVGLPAKSGVSGSLMIVIPNVMGIAVWSPRLDTMGNSVRGVEFCKELVKRFNFHNYDSLIGQSEKQDPRVNQKIQHANLTYALIWAASQGDLEEIKRLVAYGVDVNEKDYDKRTAMHLAAAEGRKEVIEYLMHQGVKINVKDRFGNTPLDDAKENKHEKIIKLLESHKSKK
jgi:glutaminase